MNNKELRWRQRFQNLEKAFHQLSEAADRYAELSDLEKEGLVKRFEYTFELFWKTLKDYLESQGVLTQYPREVIKQAYHHEIISDGEKWLDMLNLRNILAHKYTETDFREAVDAIVNKYFSDLEELYQWLKQKINHSD